MNENDLESTDTPVYPSQGTRTRPLILLADDDPEILKILTIFFQDKDCDILTASDGAAALEQVIVQKPDLLILDVMMPELNGWQVCKYIKSHDEYKDIAVIMLTAIGPVNNELTSPVFGADDHIDKPFDLDELAFKIRKVLSKKHEENSSQDAESNDSDEQTQEDTPTT